MFLYFVYPNIFSKPNETRDTHFLSKLRLCQGAGITSMEGSMASRHAGTVRRRRVVEESTLARSGGRLPPMSAEEVKTAACAKGKHRGLGGWVSSHSTAGFEQRNLRTYRGFLCNTGALRPPSYSSSFPRMSPPSCLLLYYLP